MTHEEQIIKDGYTPDTTTSTILYHIQQKLNPTEFSTIIGLIGAAFSGKIEERKENKKLLYWKRRYLNMKTKYEKMKAEKEYWVEQYQIDF